MSVVRTIKRWIHPYVSGILQRCLYHNSYNASVLTVIWAALHGFLADEWIIFELGRSNRIKDYLSERDRAKFRKSAIDYRIIFDNKMLFYNMMRGIAPLNRVYAYTVKGEYHIMEVGFEKKNIPLKLRQIGIIVFKPTSAGGGGKGFALLEYKDGKYMINRQESNENEILNLLQSFADDYILEEYCIQSDFENHIFSDTVNTLRIITAEGRNGGYSVLAVMQRMGAVIGACVDNASLGGMFAEVDLDTGELSAAFSYDPKLLFDEHRKKQCFEKHPTTGNQIKGLIIPNFDFIKKEACRIHNEIAYTGAHFVAWDFALTNDGYRVIEGNTSCGMKFLQFNRGQRYGTIGNWMREWKYIK